MNHESLEVDGVCYEAMNHESQEVAKLIATAQLKMEDACILFNVTGFTHFGP
jgi:hypothetical protein